MGTIKCSEVSSQVIAEGRRRYLASTENLMMVVIDFDDGPTSEPDPPHAHPHEQISYVVSGEVIFFLDKDAHPPGTGRHVHRAAQCAPFDSTADQPRSAGGYVPSHTRRFLAVEELQDVHKKPRSGAPVRRRCLYPRFHELDDCPHERKGFVRVFDVRHKAPPGGAFPRVSEAEQPVHHRVQGNRGRKALRVGGKPTTPLHAS